MELIAPTPELEAGFLELARDFAAAGEPRHVRAADDFGAFVEGLLAAEREEGLAPGRVPVSHYWLVDGARVLGTTRLRHRLTPALELEGGHVGYDVRPSERGRGLGTRLLALTIERARARGLQRLFLTCDADNLASRRVIERNDGWLTAEAVSPQSGKELLQFWIEIG